MESFLRLAVRGIVFPVGLFGVRGCRCLRASIAVDRKSMGHTVGERSWKNVVFVYLASVYGKGFEACG
jgi:hypothetical protein